MACLAFDMALTAQCTENRSSPTGLIAAQSNENFMSFSNFIFRMVNSQGHQPYLNSALFSRTQSSMFLLSVLPLSF
jgi:hypothetical protein